MEYTVTYDAPSDEWIATAGDDSYAVASIHLAYIWLAQQITDSDDDS